MSRRRTFAWILACLGALPAVAAEPPLEEILSDRCDLVVLVEDAPSLRKKWKENPLARAWEDPQVRKFFAPLRERMGIDRWDEEARKETGFTVDEILGILQGRCVIGVWGLAEAIEQAGTEAAPEPHAAILASVGERAGDLKKLIEQGLEKDREKAPAGTRIEEETEEFQGETLHFRVETKGDDRKETAGWAVVSGIAAFAEGRTTLQEVVASLKAGRAKAPFAASPHFRKARARSKGDLLLFMNLEPTMEALSKKIREAPANPAMMPDKAPKALGLDVLKAAYASIELSAEATHLDAGLLYTENRGLVKLLTFQEGECPRPAFLHDGLLQAWCGRFSLGECWDGVEEILAGMSPGVAMALQMQLAQVKTQSGVDLRKQLLGSLGTEIVVAKSLSAPAKPGDEPTLSRTDDLVALSVRNRKDLEAGLEAVKAMADDGGELFEKREFLGSTIYTLKTPQTDEDGREQAVSYAVTDRYLLLGTGSAAPVEAALRNLAKPGRSVWDRPEVAEALKALPAGASALGANDLSAAVGAWFRELASLQDKIDAIGISFGEEEEEGAAEGGEEPGGGEPDPFERKPTGRFCDPKAIPDAKAIGKMFGIGVDGVWRTGDGLFYRYRMVHR